MSEMTPEEKLDAAAAMVGELIAENTQLNIKLRRVQHELMLAREVMNCTEGSELDWYIRECASFFDRLRKLGHKPGGLTIDHIWVCSEVERLRNDVETLKKVIGAS